MLTELTCLRKFFILHVSRNGTSFSYCNSSECSAFFYFHINIDKDVYCLQSNSNVFPNNLWLVFSISALFLNT